ncbi:hypothetical protein ALC62_08626 [Cyphomyrmex costatus]|uniref:Uncharacterized protein n=1 Tax=Cyphomyrmex costatus TaxID=456900 RepID=A0A151IGP1_9HYME|nr:hypothetical protein ALC62_08626 [Cyphomyrmex costatus]
MGLVVRLHQWQSHFDHCIGNDVRFLKNALTRVDTLDNFTLAPPGIVRQMIRAEFRTLYFVHGTSPVFSFAVSRHLFARGNEAQSCQDGIVQLRSLEDDQDSFAFPLYTTRLTLKQMRVVRHAWLVNHGVWSRHEARMRDVRMNNTVAYTITLYATMAYTASFSGRSRTVLKTDIVRLSCRLFPKATSMFTVRWFIKTYQQRGGRRTCSGYLSPANIVKGIVDDPSTTFSRLALSCTGIHGDDDRRTLAEKMTEFVTSNVQIFPVKLIRESTATYKWSLVKHHAPTDQRPFTVEQVRRKMTMVNRERPPPPPPETQSSRPPSPPSPLLPLSPPSPLLPPPPPSPPPSHSPTRTIMTREESPSTSWRVVVTTAIVHEDPSTKTPSRSLRTPIVPETRVTVRSADESEAARKATEKEETHIAIILRHGKGRRRATSVDRLTRGIRCEGARVIGAKRSARLAAQKMSDEDSRVAQPAKRQATHAVNVKSTFTWTIDHDAAIVYYVVRLPRSWTSVYTLCSVIKSRAELFGDTTGKLLTYRMRQIAAGMGHKDLAKMYPDEMRRFLRIAKKN